MSRYGKGRRTYKERVSARVYPSFDAAYSDRSLVGKFDDVPMGMQAFSSFMYVGQMLNVISVNHPDFTMQSG